MTINNRDDIARLVLRVMLGVVMIAHGWQKFATNGLLGTGEKFAGMGLALGQLLGPLVVLLEVGGGVMVIVGALTPIVAGLFALVMFGAAIVVHGAAGFFAQSGGFEYPLVLAVLSGYLAVVGAGRLSVDAMLAPRLLRATGRASVAEAEPAGRR